MEETHIYVNRDGVVMHEAKALSTPADIEAALVGAPSCRCVVLKNVRMAPMLYHDLRERGM
ncbi:MAG: IS110 family transposase, partial [Rhodoplanes sp.]